MQVSSTGAMEASAAAPHGHRSLFYVAGIAFLALAKCKYLLRGYSTPKTFPLHQTDRCIDYAVKIGNEHVRKLRSYGVDIIGKRVLKLGPGSDLGVGLYLAQKGASSYVGFDRYDLAGKAPEEFYARMAARTGVDLACLHDGRVSFIAGEDFDVTAVSPDIDIFVSNAAFEHFDDVAKTITQLSRVVKPGGVACIGVDLQTHSSWIREADPNNIYRYPKWLYRLFYFPGQPNRLRPHQYSAMFAANGWTDIVMYPENRLNPLSPRTQKSFADERHWDWLSFTLCARKAAA